MSTLAIHHLGLAVKNLPETQAFFIDCLGWEVAGEVPDYPAVFVTNGEAFLTLWQTNEGATEFDRRANIGLHHFALRVSTEAALDELFSKVSNHPGVKVEFAPEPLNGWPAKHFMIYEPGGIRMEFIYKADA
ncbi:VOC family protein [Sessilibacter sp. MAH2]